MTTPPSGSIYADLEGVSCPSTTSCFAVGTYSTVPDINDYSETLVERYA